ncbi:type I 3-dehydroquinate dehydratase [Actinomyces naeslundii]|uniref:3-dehydroquinate dehydratase n=1 Tax=Actinomyces naeslundii TaxID=1655 RepID=A0AA47FH91_ACTNA|nr:type I 3-dehydroquinate dehydratase [Actinomyces naeslundii]OMG09455.1 3-dehydroquinase [Actinomyces naeslundii]OMG15879.1 3-dehydroquinase [Actinomyces naeslundii]PKY94489.1 type I 3-dehydroquinate dehydratase [Actinomyces naeslundii]WAL43162.1 type I 3-dehydroquinate dehydratase [Actinomyces naeslundii]
MRASSLTWGGCTIPGDGGVPAVAVSLTGPTAAHARAQARHAIDAGADVLELRVDLLEEVDALVAFTEAPSEAATDSMVVATAAAQVLECLRRMTDVIDATPLLLTCRTAAEGGRARLDDSGYSALLRSVLDELAGWEPGRRPSAVDVEVQRGCLLQVSEQAHGLGIDVVASFHDFKATPVDDVLEDVLSRMASEGADLAKIAVWPTGADDVARLLGVCARAAAAPGEGTGLGLPVAAMSMGALGAVSRVAPVFGSALTFAVVPDEQGETQASAPGQLPIQDVRRCLELLRA